MTGLVLGTAQFGTPYGATNTIGRLSDEDVREILDHARRGGVATLDTAADYADSQERLGRLAPPGSRYVTKFSLPPEPEPVDAAHLYEDSRATLDVATLSGVMFHAIRDLRDPRHTRAVEILREARASGVVGRVGVSIYDADDLQIALEVFPDLDLLQFPGNVLDRRLLESPEIARLHANGVEMHVRSALLQGILLADPDTLSPFFAPLTPVLHGLAQFAAENEVTVLGTLLRYLRDHPVVDNVVVGAIRPAELDAIIAEWNADAPSNVPANDDVPDDVLDPRRWPRD